MVRDAIADEAAAATCSWPRPTSTSSRPAEDAQSDGTKALLKEARHLVTAYNEARTPDAFLTLLDFAYLAVHNGDLDSRDNIGLRALYDWTREAVAFPALRALDHSPGTTRICSSGWATTRRCRATRSSPSARASIVVIGP